MADAERRRRTRTDAGAGLDGLSAPLRPDGARLHVGADGQGGPGARSPPATPIPSTPTSSPSAATSSTACCPDTAAHLAKLKTGLEEHDGAAGGGVLMQAPGFTAAWQPRLQPRPASLQLAFPDQSLAPRQPQRFELGAGFDVASAVSPDLAGPVVAVGLRHRGRRGRSRGRARSSRARRSPACGRQHDVRLAGQVGAVQPVAAAERPDAAAAPASSGAVSRPFTRRITAERFSASNTSVTTARPPSRSASRARRRHSRRRGRARSPGSPRGRLQRRPRCRAASVGKL